MHLIFGHDLLVGSFSFQPFVHAMRGEFALGARRAERAISHARTLHHPFSLLHALSMAGLMVFGGQTEKVMDWANEVVRIYEIENLPFWGMWGFINRAALNRLDGQAAESVREIEFGLELLTAIGGTGGKPLVLAELALSYMDLGQYDQAEHRVAEIEQMLDPSGERLTEPLVKVLRGELLLARNARDSDAAIAQFEAGAQIAREAGNKLYELRSVMALVRVLADRGERTMARDRLSGAYGLFSEGFDTVYLQQAKTMLDELI